MGGFGAKFIFSRSGEVWKIWSWSGKMVNALSFPCRKWIIYNQLKNQAYGTADSITYILNGGHICSKFLFNLLNECHLAKGMWHAHMIFMKCVTCLTFKVTKESAEMWKIPTTTLHFVIMFDFSSLIMWQPCMSSISLYNVFFSFFF